MNSKSVILAFLWMLCFTAFAQAQVTATGVVVDAATGEPIIGASVLEEGTSNGTITDFDGNFSLSVGKDAMVVISYVGYKTQQLFPKANMKVSRGAGGSGSNRLYDAAQSRPDRCCFCYLGEGSGEATGEQPDEGPSGKSAGHEYLCGW